MFQKRGNATHGPSRQTLRTCPAKCASFQKLIEGVRASLYKGVGSKHWTLYRPLRSDNFQDTATTILRYQEQ